MARPHSVSEEAGEEHCADEKIGGANKADIVHGDGKIVNGGGSDCGDSEAHIADDFGVFGDDAGLGCEGGENQKGIKSGEEDGNGEQHVLFADEDADENAKAQSPAEHAKLHQVSEHETNQGFRFDLTNDQEGSAVENDSGKKKNPCRLGFPLVGGTQEEAGERDDDEYCG